jgi:hypothetical protein
MASAGQRVAVRVHVVQPDMATRVQRCGDRAHPGKPAEDMLRTDFKAKQKWLNIPSKVQPLIPVLSRHYQVSNDIAIMSKEQLGRSISECQNELAAGVPVHEQSTDRRITARS